MLPGTMGCRGNELGCGLFLVGIEPTTSLGFGHEV
jgi:hypothetical protein